METYVFVCQMYDNFNLQDKAEGKELPRFLGPPGWGCVGDKQVFFRQNKTVQIKINIIGNNNNYDVNVM